MPTTIALHGVASIIFLNSHLALWASLDLETFNLQGRIIVIVLCILRFPQATHQPLEELSRHNRVQLSNLESSTAPLHGAWGKQLPLL